MHRKIPYEVVEYISIWGTVLCRLWDPTETSKKSQIASKTVISLSNRTGILERMFLHALFCTPAHVLLEQKCIEMCFYSFFGSNSREFVQFSPKFSVADIDGQNQDLCLWATFCTTNPTPALFTIPFTHSPMMKITIRMQKLIQWLKEHSIRYEMIRVVMV